MGTKCYALRHELSWILRPLMAYHIRCTRIFDTYVLKPLALTDRTNPAGYIKKMHLYDRELSKGGDKLSPPLRLETEGGVQRADCMPFICTNYAATAIGLIS